MDTQPAVRDAQVLDALRWATDYSTTVAASALQPPDPIQPQIYLPIAMSFSPSLDVTETVALGKKLFCMLIYYAVNPNESTDMLNRQDCFDIASHYRYYFVRCLIHRVRSDSAEEIDEASEFIISRRRWEN
ncbi:hypothetical protein RRG08_015859 [Elysia crispata]|uniref:Uncharacterized protein n=1 Tax=Elysia crispata TaxID=231223 RepID=A0AAE0XPE4_9GAST|nr:hypothetical protein RRG08_015859 [Elysia crispata]